MNDEKTRIYLINRDEPEYKFLLEISSNKKITFKISLHHQEDNTKEGLIRIDYKGGHKNPETADNSVPEYVKKYAGYWFQNEPHVHVYVEGYKNLAWAIPLVDYNFPVLSIDSNQEYCDAINAFAREINIQTPFNIQNSLL